jgi:hypothetical protein
VVEAAQLKVQMEVLAVLAAAALEVLAVQMLLLVQQIQAAEAVLAL